MSKKEIRPIISKEGDFYEPTDLFLDEETGHLGIQYQKTPKLWPEEDGDGSSQLPPPKTTAA